MASLAAGSVRAGSTFEFQPPCEGTELDAISVVVIGGTLLTGGAGSILGTLIGVLQRDVIQNFINQIGSLDSNYQSVISGAFLLVVVVIQRLLARTGSRELSSG
jgi:galactofuranose transport system permease protein